MHPRWCRASAINSSSSCLIQMSWSSSPRCSSLPPPPRWEILIPHGTLKSQACTISLGRKFSSENLGESIHVATGAWELLNVYPFFAPNSRTFKQNGRFKWTPRMFFLEMFYTKKNAIIENCSNTQDAHNSRKGKTQLSCFFWVWHLSHFLELPPSCSSARIQWRHWNNWVPFFAAHLGPPLSWHKKKRLPLM